MDLDLLTAELGGDDEDDIGYDAHSADNLLDDSMQFKFDEKNRKDSSSHEFNLLTDELDKGVDTPSPSQIPQKQTSMRENHQENPSEDINIKSNEKSVNKDDKVGKEEVEATSSQKSKVDSTKDHKREINNIPKTKSKELKTTKIASNDEKKKNQLESKTEDKSFKSKIEITQPEEEKEVSPQSIAVESGMDEAEGEVLWERTQSIISAAEKSPGAQSNNIVVVTRVRPFNKREKDLNTVNCIEVHAEDPTNHQIWIKDPGASRNANAEPTTFRFDYCFDSFDVSSKNFIDQKHIFDSVGLDILAKAWSGFNSCLFAYGQTGSGKTYSIMGYREDKGIIPRICDTLFYFIRRVGSDAFHVDASYLEVYNEQISDLLSQPIVEEDFVPLKPKERIRLEEKLKKLLKAGKMEEANTVRCLLDPAEALKQNELTKPRIREDPEKGVVVDNLKHFAVSSFADCERLLEEGLANRTVGSTAMNATSSRSHCVFTLEIQLKGKRATSKITLVDLAGSEKTQTAKTEGQSLIEGININKSLSCLGQCIAGLAKAAAKNDLEDSKKSEAQLAEEAFKREEKRNAATAAALKEKSKPKGGTGSKYGVKTGAPPKRIEQMEDFVPFRESVLTWILRDSLIGNSKTVMLAALSPSSVNYHETMSTLRFAAQAKQLKTKAIVNEDPVQRLVASLRAEIERLKVEAKSRSQEASGMTTLPPAAPGAVEDASSASLREELALAKKNLEESARETKKAIAKKEAEIAKRVAKEIAEKEKSWAEREENMKALLRQRQSRGAGSGSGGGGGRGGGGRGGSGRGKGGRGGKGRGSQGNGTSEGFLDFDDDDDGDFDLVNVKRRVVTSLMQGGYNGDNNDSQPYLTLLSRDPAISRSVRIGVGGEGEKLRIGRPGASIPQDLEVDGVGMSSETCIMWSNAQETQDSDPEVKFFVCAAAPDAIVYVNGHPVEYSSSVAEEDRCVALKHDDRVALGYCAYVLLVVDPAHKEVKEGGKNKVFKGRKGDQEITYDSCVHEVMLMRPKSDAENKERLAAFVINKLRMPATRAAFEEQLLRAVHGVREANAIIESLGLFMRFHIMGGGEVSMQRLYSLRLEDALPHHKVKISVKAVGVSSRQLDRERREAAISRRMTRKALRIMDKGEGSTNNNDDDDDSDGELLFERDDDEDDEEQDVLESQQLESQNVVFEVDVDDFDDVLLSLKLAFDRYKRTARALENIVELEPDAEETKLSFGAKLFKRAIGGSNAENGGNDTETDEEHENPLNQSMGVDRSSELIWRAFESCAKKRGNKLVLDWRDGVAASFKQIGLNNNDLDKENNLDSDVINALEVVLPSNADTSIEFHTFTEALRVHLRRKTLAALRGPWLRQDPDESTVRLLLTGTYLKSDVHKHVESSEQAALLKTIDELNMQMAKAVKQREWEIAMELEETLSIVRAQVEEEETKKKTEAAERFASRRAKSRMSQETFNVELNDGGGGGGRLVGLMRGDSISRRGESVDSSRDSGSVERPTLRARASRIISWRHAQAVVEDNEITPTIPTRRSASVGRPPLSIKKSFSHSVPVDGVSSSSDNVNERRSQSMGRPSNTGRSVTRPTTPDIAPPDLPPPSISTTPSPKSRPVLKKKPTTSSASSSPPSNGSPKKLERKSSSRNMDRDGSRSRSHQGRLRSGASSSSDSVDSNSGELRGVSRSSQSVPRGSVTTNPLAGRGRGRGSVATSSSGGPSGTPTGGRGRGSGVKAVQRPSFSEKPGVRPTLAKKATSMFKSKKNTV